METFHVLLWKEWRLVTSVWTFCILNFDTIQTVLISKAAFRLFFTKHPITEQDNCLGLCCFPLFFLSILVHICSFSTSYQLDTSNSQTLQLRTNKITAAMLCDSSYCWLIYTNCHSGEGIKPRNVDPLEKLKNKTYFNRNTEQETGEAAKSTWSS